MRIEAGREVFAREVGGLQAAVEDDRVFVIEATLVAKNAHGWLKPGFPRS